tara:strand:+ start:150 stop:443 length:294 start_codon:yes stop_codon:yes gene_type:complete
MTTRENYTLQKVNDIEQQILIYLTTNHEKHEIITEDTSDFLEFEIQYFMIERKTITVNLNFYRNDDTESDPIWLYRKQLVISEKELLERLEVLTSYE